MPINDGGPAFPPSVAEIQDRATNSCEFGLPGMSLRDYFAAKAMQAALHPEVMRCNPALLATRGDEFLARIAKSAFMNGRRDARRAGACLVSAQPMSDVDMRETFGRRNGRTCESCAHLTPRMAPPKAEAHNQQALITFTCGESGGYEPWSVLMRACGRFQEAR